MTAAAVELRSAVPLKPLIRHPGGKSEAAEVIAGLLGYPDQICEPFAGGLAVSLLSGARPVYTAEVIPAIRDMYNHLAADAAGFWRAYDQTPSSIEDEAAFFAFREAFNANQTGANYLALNRATFNGTSARFNAKGRTNGSAGDLPYTRPTFKGLREAYASRFEGCVCLEDWQAAVRAAVEAGIKIVADPPYLDTFSYSKSWGIGDLCALADALPVGALVCERSGPERQTCLFGAQHAEGILLERGFVQVHAWKARNHISCGQRTVRSEGIWRKVAA